MKYVGLRQAPIALLLLEPGCSARPPIAEPEPQSVASAPASAAASPCAVVASYQPREASTIEVKLPPVPALPSRAVRNTDAYTVWGASYWLRSPVHRADVEGKDVVIEGVITRTNLLEAPRCAIHPTGQADPVDCTAPIPAFWLGDDVDADPRDTIKVMGWASNYAQLYDAIRAFDAGEQEAIDSFWGVLIPNPLPVRGARVSVRGRYGTSFAKASSGAEFDVVMGLLTLETMTVLEPATELATLPGISRRIN